MVVHLSNFGGQNTGAVSLLVASDSPISNCLLFLAAADEKRNSVNCATREIDYQETTVLTLDDKTELSFVSILKGVFIEG